MAQQRQSINFDDGFKSYEINGDPQRIVRIDTADYGLIERLRNAKNNINEEMKKYENIKIKSDGSADLDDDTAADSLRDLGKFICGQFDYIFNSEVSGVLFGTASPLSTRGGVPLFERVFNAVLPIIETDIKSEQKKAEARIKKYEAEAARFKNSL